LKKEEVARRYILKKRGANLKFLDVGSRNSKLEYLLGIRKNLEFDNVLYNDNYKLFNSKYQYFGLDIHNPDNVRNVIIQDICNENFTEEYNDYFDVIYSNNVFEHLKKPWVAARNIFKMLKKGGIVVTITQFSIRYHECPADYFRYSHIGLNSLFEECGEVKILESGYDISGRRNNWQGQGGENDIVPVDNFGAWRENWFTVSVVEKK
jgi:SAM-dependent methyltransferase